MSHSTWAKICGITRLVDAQAAAAAGADAIGLNFYPASPRYIDVPTAADFVRQVSVPSVGVFVDAEASWVQQVLAAVPLDVLQFHGEETPAFCESFGQPYIKALRMPKGVDIRPQIARFHTAWAILLDADVAGLSGGTGQPFDWQDWPHRSNARLIVAGGLSPDNVAAAVTQLQPFGVDVAGGVEQNDDGQQLKGIKDPDKIELFMTEVHSGQ